VFGSKLHCAVPTKGAVQSVIFIREDDAFLMSVNTKNSYKKACYIVVIAKPALLAFLLACRLWQSHAVSQY
jgi:hypothetical protein